MAATLTIIAFRDIFQDEAKKKSRYSEDYRRLSAQIILDQQDMSALGVKDGQSLLVSNDAGSVVVAAKTSDDDPHPGLAFMICSPWSNQLIGEDTCNANISGARSVSAQVSPSNDNITQISEIFQRILA